MGAFTAVAVLTTCVGTAAAETRVFNASTGEQTFPVPAGVTSVQVTATGQSGRGGLRPNGRGAIVTGTLTVTPGSTLFVEVGAFNGGGAPNGGGASDVRTIPVSAGASSLASRLLIAAGGGGPGTFPPATPGLDADSPTTTPSCSGGGASENGGGTAGTGGGSTGTAGRGGNGASSAGGGGGGLWGGGGGGAPGGSYCGGGGGFSKVPPGGSKALAALDTPPSLAITFTPPAGAGGQGGGSGGGSGMTLRDTAKPAVSGLSFSPSAFQAAGSGAAIKAAVGGNVTYRLSEPATTTFTVHKIATGRKKGKRCAKPTRKNRQAKRCTRYVKVRGSFTHAGKAGRNTFTYRGRIGGRKLRPGRYRLTGKAKDAAGNTSKAITARFRITR